jgi:gamma-glutamylputrescine oxidase
VGEYLRRQLREHFPQLGDVEVEAEWTGVLGFTRDRKPLIGEVREGVWVAAGFCGHGMPQCFGAAKAIASMIAGEHDEVHAFVSGPANVARVLPSHM